MTRTARSLLLVCLLSMLSCKEEIVTVDDSPDLSNGLAVHYPFSGNAKDATGNFPPALVVGAKLVTNRFGVDSSAYRFNGSTDYILCGDILDDVFSDSIATFTISGWAKTRSYGSFASGGGFILGKNAGGNFGPYQWNITHADGLLYAGVFSDTAALNYRALTTPIASGRWFHFALIFDGNRNIDDRMKFYVNGQTFDVSVFQNVGTLGTTTTNSLQNLSIGASHLADAPQAPANFYDGDIDDIRIYRRPLTMTEVQVLYNLVN